MDSQPDDFIGKRFGHFRIQSPLGSGGMGMVFVATDEKLGRTVALKLLHPERGQRPKARAQFLREAQTAATVHHPNIATIFEVGFAHDQLFIAMELVEGRPLGELVAGPRLPIRRVVTMAIDIARALDRIHAAGIIHRDLKPSNLMLDQSGAVKLLDFGLAKPLRIDDDPAATTTGAIRGTPAYMAPEQARDETLDPRADQFGFGCVVYELLTGKSPFLRSSVSDTVAAITRDEPPDVAEVNPRVPPQLAAIVRRCLAKARDDRYASTDALVASLVAAERELDSKHEALGPTVSAVRKPRDARGTRHTPSRKRGLLVAGGVGIATMVIAVVLLATRAEKHKATSQPDANTGDEPTAAQELAPQLRERQLTSRVEQHPIYSGMLSPDGTLLAFTDQQGLWVKRVPAGVERLVLASPPDAMMSLGGIYSDSHRIAYAVGRAGDTSVPLWMTTVDGDEPRLLFEQVYRASLSPADDRWAFNNDDGVWLADPDGANRQRVMPLDDSNSLAEIAWSPDGTRLAWIRDSINDDVFLPTVELVRLGSPVVHTIAKDRRLVGAIHESGIAFRDDEHLLYVLQAIGSDPEAVLMEQQLRADSHDVVGPPRVLKRWPVKAISLFSVARGGAIAAFHEHTEQTDVFVYELDDEGRLGREVRSTFDERNSSPNGWTRDGRLLYSTSGSDETRSIWAVHPGDKRATSVVGDGTRTTSAHVTPDDLLIFARSTDSEIEWFSADIAGDHQRTIFVESNPWKIVPPEIRCGGSRCMHSRYADGYVVWRDVDLEVGLGDEVARLAIPRDAKWGDWDIDSTGRRLAVAIARPPEIHILDLETGDRRRISVAPKLLAQRLAWAPDGNSLYMTAMYFDEHTYGLARLGLDGTMSVLAANDDTWLSAPSPSPDGRRLALVKLLIKSNMWLLEGFE